MSPSEVASPDVCGEAASFDKERQVWRSGENKSEKPDHPDEYFDINF